MQTKLEKLKQMWAAGAYRAALKLAASWPELGAHKAPIQQGWAACSNAKIYKQMGKDPEALYEAGLAAVAERYGLHRHIAHPVDCFCVLCLGKKRKI